MVAGKEVFGALNIFYAELQNNLPISPSATAFLSQGKMPTFILAYQRRHLMYHTAAPANRHKIKGLLLSGVMLRLSLALQNQLNFILIY